MEKTVEEMLREICDRADFYEKEHRSFFMKMLMKIQKIDAYHVALMYTLGISKDTRGHIENLYDFKEMRIKPEGLFEGWQTYKSQRVTAFAFNLYNNGNLSPDEHLMKCIKYAVEDISYCLYSFYFWQAVKLRYPEYCGKEQRYT